MTQVVCIGGWGQSKRTLDIFTDQIRPSSSISTLPAHELFATAEPRMTGSRDYAEALSKRIPDASTLIGWSMGGIIALETALRFPEKVHSLILISASACFTESDEGRGSESVSRLREMRNAIDADPAALFRGFLQAAWSPEEVTDSELSRMIDDGLCIPPAALLDGLTYLEKTDLRESLSKITVPALVIHGKQDRIISESASRLLFQQLPEATLHSLGNSGHMLPISRAEELGREARDWLETHRKL